MADDFNGQIDYLEQFGSSNVSPFFSYSKYNKYLGVCVILTFVLLVFNSSKNLH